MIILPPHHPLVEAILEKEKIDSQASQLDTTFSDLDRSIWRLQSTESTYSLSVTLSDACHNTIFSTDFHAIDRLEEIYPSSKFTIKYEPSTTTIQWSRSIMKNMDINDVMQLSLFKRHLLSIPFIQIFQYFDKWSVDAEKFSKEKSPVIQFSYRDQESLYLQAFPDRVVVIFSTVFQDPSDAVLGKVFLQEFVDARKSSSLQNSPQVIYSKDPPPELLEKESLNPNGYISFVLFPRHIQQGTRRNNAVNMLINFRSYFHYHIKCSKAYIHSRLRVKTEESLKVLNRAHPEHQVSKPTKL